jgi:hypothetical protein
MLPKKFIERSLLDRRPCIDRRVINLGPGNPGKDKRMGKERRKGWENRFGWTSLDSNPFLENVNLFTSHYPKPFPGYFIG